MLAHTHMHARTLTLSAASQRNWGPEPKGLTVSGGSYMHQCNLMVHNLHFFRCAWLGGNALGSASQCPSQLASAVFARPAGEWQVNLTTQVQQRLAHYPNQISVWTNRTVFSNSLFYQISKCIEAYTHTHAHKFGNKDKNWIPYPDSFYP